MHAVTYRYALNTAPPKLFFRIAETQKQGLSAPAADDGMNETDENADCRLFRTKHDDVGTPKVHSISNLTCPRYFAEFQLRPIVGSKLPKLVPGKQTMDIVGCESPGLDANFWGQPQGKSIAEWIYRGMCRRSAEEQENHIYCPPGDLRVKHGG